MSEENIISFLKINLPQKAIATSFIFGSLAQGKINPSDCDLFIVTTLKPDTSDWLNFIRVITDVKVEFLARFGLELNTLINTESEFKEHRALKNRILIKNIIPII